MNAETATIRPQTPASSPRSPDFVHLPIAMMCALAAIVGVVTGFGALVFRLMISFVHNLLFLHTISLNYDSSQFTGPHPWGAWVILVPVIGAVIITFIVANFAGVPVPSAKDTTMILTLFPERHEPPEFLPLIQRMFGTPDRLRRPRIHDLSSTRCACLPGLKRG